jgi:hypothetical protein
MSPLYRNRRPTVGFSPNANSGRMLMVRGGGGRHCGGDRGGAQARAAQGGAIVGLEQGELEGGGFQSSLAR